jgi:hypothetical protein
MSESGRKEFRWVTAYDGALRLILGGQLGRWDGRVAGSWVS